MRLILLRNLGLGLNAEYLGLFSVKRVRILKIHWLKTANGQQPHKNQTVHADQAFLRDRYKSKDTQRTKP